MLVNIISTKLPDSHMTVEVANETTTWEEITALASSKNSAFSTDNLKALDRNNQSAGRLEADSTLTFVGGEATVFMTSATKNKSGGSLAIETAAADLKNSMDRFINELVKKVDFDSEKNADKIQKSIEELRELEEEGEV